MAQVSGTRPPALGRFAIGELMGKGMQASVRRGRDLHANQDVALRIVNRRHLTPAKLGKLEREINMMKIVNHPNIIALKHVEMDMEWQRINGTTKRVALMVLEIADNGELFDYLMYSGYFNDEITRAYMSQLLSALKVCHSNLIYHRDIKPENILLDSNFQLKLADFGLSTIQEREDAMLQTDCGTKSYMAPEVLAASPYHGEQADIWSAGVVMFTMLCGNPPFQLATKQDWWFNAVSLNRYDRFWAAHLRSAGHMATNTVAQNFINHIFVKNPEDRYTIDNMFDDPWMSSMPHLSPEGLKAQMMQKKHDVLQGKEREAQAAANRAKHTVGGGQYDPFGQATTYRSIKDEPSLPVGNLESMGQTSFFSTVGPSEVVSSLKKTFGAIDNKVESNILSEGFGVRVKMSVGSQIFEFDGETIEIPAVPIEFDVRLTSISDVTGASGVVGVEFVRIAGDVVQFQNAFKQIRASFDELNKETINTQENDSKDFFLSDDTAQNEEPLLEETMSMI
jgi:serine/threonine protein kinase